MPVYFGTLDKALSFSLAFEHKYVMFMKIKITVNFILSGSSENLSLMYYRL